MKTEHKIQNAIITKATLSAERGFILDSWIHLDYGGSGQGFGGYILYLDESATHHSLLSHAGHWIWRVMEIAGVESWDKLPGKTIRAIIKDGLVIAIGHIVNDDWFYPSNDFYNKEVPYV